MDVRSGYINVQSETGLSMRMIGRMAAFDCLRFGRLVEPDGWLPKGDYVDILWQDFSDVRTPVFFGNTYARQAGYPNQQTHRRAISGCGSHWSIPEAELSPGCKYPSPLYMEADSAYAPGGPLDARAITGGSTLIRGVRIADSNIGSTATVCGSASAKIG